MVVKLNQIKTMPTKAKEPTLNCVGFFCLEDTMGASGMESIGGNLKRKYDSAKKSVKNFMKEDKNKSGRRLSGDWTKDSYQRYTNKGDK